MWCDLLINSRKEGGASIVGAIVVQNRDVPCAFNNMSWQVSSTSRTSVKYPLAGSLTLLQLVRSRSVQA